MRPGRRAGAAASALEQGKAELERRKLDLEEEKFALERQKHAESRWWHEDHLVNHRLTWLLTSQGLLFAGLFLMEQPRVVPDESHLEYGQQAADLAALLPAVGGFTALMVLMGTFAARWAQARLKRKYRAQGIDLGVSTATTVIGATPSVALPGVFVLLWWRLGVELETLARLADWLGPAGR